MRPEEITQPNQVGTDLSVPAWINDIKNRQP